MMYDLRFTNSLQFTVYNLLLTTYYLQPKTYYLQLTTYNPQLTTHNSPWAVQSVHFLEEDGVSHQHSLSKPARF